MCVNDNKIEDSKVHKRVSTQQQASDVVYVEACLVDSKQNVPLRSTIMASSRSCRRPITPVSPSSSTRSSSSCRIRWLCAKDFATTSGNTPGSRVRCGSADDDNDADDDGFEVAAAPAPRTVVTAVISVTSASCMLAELPESM